MSSIMLILCEKFVRRNMLITMPEYWTIVQQTYKSPSCIIRTDVLPFAVNFRLFE
jgi:hypothetical protein